MADQRKRLIAEVRAVVDGAREVEQLAGGLDNVENRARRQYPDPTQRMREGMSGTRKVVLGLTTAFTALGGALAFRELIRATNQYRQLTGQLNTVTESQEETNERFRDLREIANDTFAPLRSTIELYTRVTRATEELGDATETQVMRFTEVVNQAIAASGASQEEASNATRQLTQGLASGIFRAEEFNSVLEQTPRLAQAIADGLGVSIGQLREMLLAGELTSDKVFQAILDQTDELEREFQSLPKRVDQSLTQLGNDLTAAFGKADVDGLVESIDDFREIVTDPQFVNAVTGLAEAVFDLGAGLAEVTKFLGGPGELNTERQEEQLTELRQELERLLDEQADMVDAGEDIVARAIGNRIEEVKRAIRRLGVTPDELLSESDSGSESDRPDTGGGVGGDGSADDGADDAAEERAQKLRELIEAQREEARTVGKSAEELALYKARQLGATEADLQAIREAFEVKRAREAQIEADEKAAEAARERAEAQKKAREQDRETVDSLQREVELQRMGEQARFVQQELDQLSPDAPKEMRKEVARLARELYNLRDTAEGTSEELSEFAKSAAQNMQSEFADFLFDPFEEGLDGLADSFIRTLRRMAAEAAAAEIFDEMFGGDQGFASFLDSIFNSGGSSSSSMGAGTGSSPASASGGSSGSGWANLIGTVLGAVFHDGGVVGAGGAPTRAVPAGTFAGAGHFSTGGVAGLGPREVPIIAHENEEILTDKDPRHRDNLGRGKGGGTTIIQNIQTPDAQSFRRSSAAVRQDLKMATREK